MITDAAIRKALRAGTFQRLADPAPRGHGRLLAVVKPPLVEWYAQRIVAGQRKLSKLGTWPAMSIAEAREAFAGHRAKPDVARDATLGAMLDAYVASLRAAGKPSADQVERILELAGNAIGRHRLARDIEPADIVAAIKPIFDRGARVQADKHRMYLGAAFRWAMQRTHDYTQAAAMDYGLKASPVDAVARDTDAEGVGERYLSIAELTQLITWARLGRGAAQKAILLLCLTGQRVREITELRASQWDSRERLLSWATTKTGTPHCIPVCGEAAELLDQLAARAGRNGYLFPAPSKKLAGQPITDAAVLRNCQRFSRLVKGERFTGRDLRRTWKTLAGQAGVSKEDRDRLQNHSAGDVSSRHYDRWQYLPEKRAAVARWEGWLQEQVREQRAKKRAQQVVQAKKHAGGQDVGLVV
jgi:integrase